MTKLEEVILYILNRANKKGIQNLSKFELFKYIYLLEVESYKFTGKSFFDESVGFERDTNGPISYDIYNTLTELQDKYITITTTKRPDYPYPRNGISLKKEIKKFDLSDSMKLFINSILESYLPLPINQLKKIVYQTPPMQDIQQQEKKKKGAILKGRKLDFGSIPLDEDVVELITA